MNGAVLPKGVWQRSLAMPWSEATRVLRVGLYVRQCAVVYYAHSIPVGITDCPAINSAQPVNPGILRLLQLYIAFYAACDEAISPNPRLLL
jgi:hypothetical protein